MANRIKFALTFDDGPGPHTEALLDVLQQFNIKATFFILGKNLAKPYWRGSNRKKTQATLIRALREGHILGNHTYSHLMFEKPDAIRNDIKRCDALIRKLSVEAGLKKPASILFRLPYGIKTIFVEGFSFPDPRLSIIKRMGRKHTGWTGIFQDWNMNSKNQASRLSEEMKSHVLEVTKQGKIPVLCLHDGSYDAQKFKHAGRSALIAISKFLKYAERHRWESVPLRSKGC